MFFENNSQKLFDSNALNIFMNKDLNKLLNGKSKYLKNLEKKKNDSYKLINIQKFEIMKEKLLRANRFERNYSLFSKNDIEIKPTSTHTQKFYFSPDIKPLFLSEIEEVYPNRYKKKKFDTDNFSLIYKVTNSVNYPEKKPIIVLNTSVYSKYNENRKYKGASRYKGISNDKKNSEDRKINEYTNNSKSNKSNMISKSIAINKSNISNYNSSFLTSVGNNVMSNKDKYSLISY